MSCTNSKILPSPIIGGFKVPTTLLNLPKGRTAKFLTQHIKNGWSALLRK